jgi:orotate phosphoribosyltransferase
MTLAVVATSSYILAMTSLGIIVILCMIAVAGSKVTSWRRSQSASKFLAMTLKRARDNPDMNGSEVLVAIRRTPISVIASNRALRTQVYEALDTIAPAEDEATRRQTDPRAASISTVMEISPPLPQMARRRSASREKAYVTIDTTLARVPRTIPEDANNPPQMECLETLADALAPLYEPFRTWSKSFRSAAEALAGVLPMRQKLDALLSTALKAKTNFDIDFYEAANEIRECAQDRDETGCAGAIEKLATSVVSWVDLTTDWYSLRRDAAASISYSENPGHEWWGWLRHIAVDFREPGTGRPMVWWQSSLLSRSDSLERLSTWIIREIDDRIRDKKWTADFSAICSMSSTGVPLATLLSSHYGKRLLIVDEGAEYNFPPGFEPRLGDKILMVDSNISTGEHLGRCAERISNARASVVGAVFIAENDLSDKTRGTIVDGMRQRDGVIHLFTLGDIYGRWKEEGELLETSTSLGR